MRQADLVLSLGTQLTDMNLGAAKPQVSRERSVWAIDRRVNVSFHQYTDVSCATSSPRSPKRELPRFRERVRYYDNLKTAARRPAVAPGAGSRSTTCWSR